MTTELPDHPESREESYLADIAGQEVTLPERPLSRKEQYLAYIAENGGGGGGGTTNFNQLTNRPKYNGTTMTGSTNIPEVKTYTAGTNVSISGTTISATDTTYSNFTGTDGTAAGTAGLVPAPATTDAGKFLKADGTWDTAGTSSYTAGDGIDITSNIISATNTGKAKELTSADYNYPANNPTAIALWLLDEGQYYLKKNTVYSPYNDSAVTAGGVSVTVLTKAVDNFRGSYIIDTGNQVTSTIIYSVDVDGNNSSEYPLTTVVNNTLISSNTSQALSANQGRVLKELVDSLTISGAGAPTVSTVGTVGKLYEDTVNGKLYICTAVVPGVDPNPDTYTWEELGSGGGSGPTVVQTTGTSTADVMSQNAVTVALATKQDATSISNNTLYI